MRWFSVFAVLAALTGAPLPLTAQNTPPANLPKARFDLRGRVVRTDAGRIVIETRDQKQMIFVVSPTTEYRLNAKAVPYTSVRVGTVVDATYMVEGDRYLVNTIILLPGEQFVPVPASSAPLDATVVEGQVTRVVGNDQIVLSAGGGKELILYVTPQTAYKLTPQGGSFTELRAGMAVQVAYTVADRRNVVRTIVGLPIRNP